MIRLPLMNPSLLASRLDDQAAWRASVDRAVAAFGRFLAEHDLDVALKQVVRRSCSGEAAPMAVRMQIMQRITMVRLESDG